MPRATIPCALAIGGLDPGGGAGLVADLRAFDAAGAFGCAVAAVVTVQSTRGLRSVRALEPRLVAEQAREVLDAQDVRAAKVGALGSAANVRAVARLFERHHDHRTGRLPLVVDTPIKATRASRAGAHLTAEGALTALRRELLPRATLVTVNLEEAGVLLGGRVRTPHEAREAADKLAQSGAFAVLVKGGHLTGPVATDFLALGGRVIELSAPRLDVGAVHGTGCTFASLVAGRLAAGPRATARGDALVSAVRWAKRAHHTALSRSIRVGSGMKVLRF